MVGLNEACSCAAALFCCSNRSKWQIPVDATAHSQLMTSKVLEKCEGEM